MPFRRHETTGEVLAVLGVVRDVTDAVRAEEQRKHAAPRRPVLVDGTEHIVSASIGITYGGSSRGATGQATSDVLLHEADAAMYRAKRQGKDRFEVSEQGQPPASGVPSATPALPAPRAPSPPLPQPGARWSGPPG